MRSLKIVGFVVGGLLLLLVLLLVMVSLLVNPNEYKGRIEAEVKTATGRDLTLQGDIKLSVFPWVALKLGPLSLGNPAGFGSDPFLTVQRTALRVKLLPLLRKRLEIGRIEIDGLDLRLKTNADGKGNWQDPGQKQKPAAAANSGGGSAGSLQSLDGIRITGSRISYNALTLSGLEVDVGSVSQRVAVPVTAQFDMNSGPGGTSMHLRADLKATLDSVAQRYGLEAVKFDGDLRLKDSGSKLPWKFTAPALDVDLAAQTLKAAGFSMDVGAAHLDGSLAGEKILAAPQFGGSFRLEPLMLRDFSKQLDVALPKTRDPAALSKISASSDFSYGLNALQLQKLSAQLDDTRLSGAAAIANLDTKALTFDLKVDHIDLDRYMAPKAATAAPGARTRAITAAPAPSPLPTTAVRALNLDGTFVIESAKVEGMTVSAVSLKMQARDGVVHLSPLKASLYGGTYAGDLTYDAHGAVPAVNVDQQVSGVDMAALLKDGMKSERLSGHGNATTKLAGAGLTSEALLRNLSGRVEMNLADGAVMGIDLWYELNRAQALLKQQSVPGGSDDKRTKFDSFRASADVSGGVATTKDLNVASQNLRVTGVGTTNLVSEAIDYHIVASVLKAPPTAKNTAQSQLTLGDIPVEITGTTSDPKVRPDLQGLMKSQLRQKLQNTLKDQLHGILGH